MNERKEFMKLNNNDIITILNLLNVNLKEETLSRH